MCVWVVFFDFTRGLSLPFLFPFGIAESVSEIHRVVTHLKLNVADRGGKGEEGRGGDSRGRYRRVGVANFRFPLTLSKRGLHRGPFSRKRPLFDFTSKPVQLRAILVARNFACNFNRSVAQLFSCDDEPAPCAAPNPPSPFHFSLPLPRELYV